MSFTLSYKIGTVTRPYESLFISRNRFFFFLREKRLLLLRILLPRFISALPILLLWLLYTFGCGLFFFLPVTASSSPVFEVSESFSSCGACSSLPLNIVYSFVFWFALVVLVLCFMYCCVYYSSSLPCFSAPWLFLWKTHTDWQSVWATQIADPYGSYELVIVDPYGSYELPIRTNHTDQQSVWLIRISNSYGSYGSTIRMVFH